MLAMRPANMTLQEAAAGVATGGVTASRVLRKAKIKRGQKVLVRSLRADHVIDYTHQDLADGASYDVVFDAVDKLASSRGKQTLKEHGIYLNVSSDSGSGGGGGGRLPRLRVL